MWVSRSNSKVLPTIESISRIFQIISLLDMYPDLSGLALVFDYMPHTLYSKLKDEENPLSRQQIQSYTRMLLRGLSYLHDDLRIMHRVRMTSWHRDLTWFLISVSLEGYQASQSSDQRARYAQDCRLWPRPPLQSRGDSKVLQPTSGNALVSITGNSLGNANLRTVDWHVGGRLCFRRDAPRRSALCGEAN